MEGCDLARRLAAPCAAGVARTECCEALLAPVFDGGITSGLPVEAPVFDGSTTGGLPVEAPILDCGVTGGLPVEAGSKRVHTPLPLDLSFSSTYDACRTSRRKSCFLWLVLIKHLVDLHFSFAHG